MASAIFVGLASTSCYRYIAVSPADGIPPGALVRVQLNDTGTSAVHQTVGPAVVAVDGETLAWRSDSVVLSVRNARTRSGERFAWTGLRVAFPPSSIERIERRELSRSRSVILGAGAAAAAALVIKVAIDAAAGGTPGGGGPPPPQP
ncbi:MAG: hypothetical protein ACT4PJ_13845 [Gemmatimonadaceae bacterium]